MVVTSVRSGGNAVIGSGTVIAYKNEEIEVTLEIQEHDDPFTVIFDFTEDGGDPDVAREIVKEDGRAVALKLILENHGESNFAGPDEPLSVGTMANRDLHLTYNLSTKQGRDVYTRSLTYTFYLMDD